MLTETLLHIFRIFDKDDDGLISVDELRHIMLSFGEKMTEKELDEMISEANCDKDGHIDYDGMYFLHISFRLRTQLPSYVRCPKEMEISKQNSSW